MTKQQFQEASNKAGVSLSNDEMKRIGILFPSHKKESTGTVDFVQMSQDLNLHYSSLNYVDPTVLKVQNLKNMVAKRGRSVLKQYPTTTEII